MYQNINLLENEPWIKISLNRISVEIPIVKHANHVLRERKKERRRLACWRKVGYF